MQPCRHDLLPIAAHGLDMACSYGREIDRCHFEEVENRIEPVLRLCRDLIPSIDRGQRIRQLTPPVRDLSFDIDDALQAINLLANLGERSPVVFKYTLNVAEDGLQEADIAVNSSYPILGGHVWDWKF